MAINEKYIEYTSKVEGMTIEDYAIASDYLSKNGWTRILPSSRESAIKSMGESKVFDFTISPFRSRYYYHFKPADGSVFYDAIMEGLLVFYKPKKTNPEVVELTSAQKEELVAAFKNFPNDIDPLSELGKDINVESIVHEDKIKCIITSKRNEKPPIGLSPIYASEHYSARYAEVKEALIRYIEADRGLPTKWLEELESLRRKLRLEETDRDVYNEGD